MSNEYESVMHETLTLKPNSFYWVVGFSGCAQVYKSLAEFHRVGTHIEAAWVIVNEHAPTPDHNKMVRIFEADIS